MRSVPISFDKSSEILSKSDDLKDTQSKPGDKIHEGRVFSCYGKRYEKCSTRQRLKASGEALWDIAISKAE